jgi:ferric-dicitrate binding protein FerR (iron transport regulator)
MPDETPPSPPRKSWTFVLAVLAILAALPVGYFLFLRGTPAPAPPPVTTPPPPPGPKKMELIVAEVGGTVERKQPDGAWVPIAQGTPLKPSDAVRTGGGSYAVLVGGEAYEVRMEAGTEVSVADITETISQLLLNNGMATARVLGRSRHSFEVKAAGSDAVAKARSGKFTISNNGQGTVAVGTAEGEVELVGSGKVVIVRAGQQSIVVPGKPPSEPERIPGSLLLKVAFPTEKQINKRKLVLAGEAEPGAVVEVQGTPVAVDNEGRFRTELALKEGRNALQVKTRAVGGLTAQQSKEVVVDTTPPKLGVDKDLWTKPP